MGGINPAPTVGPGTWPLDPPIARAEGPNDWPMFGHNPARTSYNADETRLKPPLRLKWSYETGEVVYPSPAVADGIVYVGSHDGAIYTLDAVDAATGALH